MIDATFDQDISRRANTALKVSMLEGGLHAVMVGVAESYLGAFAVELGHGPRRLALLATLPLFVGACCQLFSPLFCAWLGNRKRVAMAGALGQIVSIAALLAIASTETSSLLALLLAKLGFWVSGGVMVPAWNSWMANLTLHTHRPRYFGRRSTLNHVALLLSFGVAGLALHRAGAHVLSCYVVLFGVALLALVARATALALQLDLEAPKRRHVSDAVLLPRLRQAVARGHFRVTAYLAALAFGTQVAAPFFTLYMLRDLALDYRAYAALAGLSILAKVLTFPLCHRLTEWLGLERVLSFAGVGVAAVPILWAVSSSFPTLALAHVAGGVVWAAVEYASFQLLLDDAPAELTTEFFSVSNTLTGLSQLSGALLGGWLLGLPGVSYTHVFVLSTLLRGVPLILLFMAIHPERFPTWLHVIYTSIKRIQPLTGSSVYPLLAATEVPSQLGSRKTDPPPAL